MIPEIEWEVFSHPLFDRGGPRYYTRWEVVAYTFDVDGNRTYLGTCSGDLADMPKGMIKPNEAGIAAPKEELSSLDLATRIHTFITEMLDSGGPRSSAEAERSLALFQMLTVLRLHPSAELVIHWD